MANLWGGFVLAVSFCSSRTADSASHRTQVQPTQPVQESPGRIGRKTSRPTGFTQPTACVQSSSIILAGGCPRTKEHYPTRPAIWKQDRGIGPTPLPPWGQLMRDMVATDSTSPSLPLSDPRCPRCLVTRSTPTRRRLSFGSGWLPV